MNNKGFMMAEVIVVASIILVAMVGLYASYNKIFSLYNQRVDYYDVATLYELAREREENKDVIKDEIKYCIDNNKYVGSIDDENNTMFLLNVSKISEFNETYVSVGLKDYISFLVTSLDVETNYILVMERCIDADNCKYAYLEVFDDETA